LSSQNGCRLQIKKFFSVSLQKALSFLPSSLSSALYPTPFAYFFQATEKKAAFLLPKAHSMLKFIKNFYKTFVICLIFCEFYDKFDIY